LCWPSGKPREVLNSFWRAYSNPAATMPGGYRFPRGLSPNEVFGGPSSRLSKLECRGLLEKIMGKIRL